MPLVKIKDFDAINDNKPFFDQPIKKKQEANKKLGTISKNDDYTTGNSLDYLNHQKYYKLIGIVYQGKQIQLFNNKLISKEN